METFVPYQEATRTVRAKGAPLPFSPEESERIEFLVPRIRGELISAVSKVRSGSQSVLSLAKKLGIDRNLCRRVVSSLKPGVSDWELLEKLPGPEGLRMFALAAAKEITGKDVRSVLLSSVEQYELLVQELGGSQTKFLNRLRATRQIKEGAAMPPSEMDNVETRARIREAATELLGYDVGCLSCLTVVRPIPDSPELVELLQASGLIRLRPLRGPIPVVFYGYAMRTNPDDLREEQHATPLTNDPHGMGLLGEFCSEPLPTCVTEGSDGHARLVLDADQRSLGAMFDVATATHWAPGVNPAVLPDQDWWYQVHTIRRPTKRLIFDVYLHRSMASSCIPSAAAFNWNPAITGDLARHWDQRLPGRITIEMLGRGTRAAATDAWQAQKQFTDRVFELGGWNPDEFVGFRVDVHEPIWGGAYFMSFDFSDSAPTEP